MNKCLKCGHKDNGSHVFLRSCDIDGRLPAEGGGGRVVGIPAMLCGWCCSQMPGREWMRERYDALTK